jgi:hypothetical protein
MSLLTDAAVAPGFRSPPNRRNLVRWHETYIVAFVPPARDRLTHARRPEDRDEW